MSYSTILFDLDGTLMDTSEGILHSIDHAVREMELPPLSKEQLRSFIGPPIYIPFQAAYHLSQEMTDRFTQIFRTVYKNAFLFEAEVYPGMVRLLEDLRDRGFKTAIATNKREDYTITLLRHFDLLRLFDVVRGSDFQNQLTKVDIINACFAHLQPGSLTEAVFIGDTQHDAQAAQKAGVDFIGVTYGFGFNLPEEAISQGAIDSCRNAEELASFLLK